MAKTKLCLFVLTFFIGTVFGYPSGMPDNPKTCLDMTPNHTPYAPQSHPPRFDIIVREEIYSTSTIDVTIRMHEAYKLKGFAIQARRVDEGVNKDAPVGMFENDPGTQIVCNGREGNGLTHMNDSAGSQTPKSSITLKWTPQTGYGHIQFRVTVVVDKSLYWVAEPSRTIYDKTQPIPSTTTLYPPMEEEVFDQISAADCGRTKGCYRNPPGCSPTSNCDIFASWTTKRAEPVLDFTLIGDTDGWVALGLSHDLKMGDDTVFECVWNNEQGLINKSMNFNDKTNSLVNAQSVDQTFPKNLRHSQLIDRRLTCQFRYVAVSADEYRALTETDYHLLLAKGPLKKDGTKDRHLLEPGKSPYVSVHSVKLSSKEDFTHTTRYILVKVHGCLMLLGWMMCASTALILAKYYKPMWPNNRMCGVRVWFACHRGLMVVNLFATVIAFILIFIHAWGYSKMPDLPAKAHPILGIITTILCVLNPLIALCKCSEKSDKRPIFNWVHWFIGTCATVLATPTLFIGLNLPKAHVPWWATWILVAFMLFHLIIELMLEIHGCLNANKQKYRTQEYEMRRPKDNREQEPVGTRFKKIILAIYVPVVCILGLVMIIAVAAG